MIVVLFLGFGPPLNVHYQAQVDTIMLSWNEPDQGGGAATVDGYKVRWSLKTKIEGEQQVTGTSIRIPNLLSNAEYFITIIAISLVDRSNDAAIISATTGQFIAIYFFVVANSIS